jgi:hypothetical protein
MPNEKQFKSNSENSEILSNKPITVESFLTTDYADYTDF